MRTNLNANRGMHKKCEQRRAGRGRVLSIILDFVKTKTKINVITKSGLILEKIRTLTFLLNEEVWNKHLTYNNLNKSMIIHAKIRDYLHHWGTQYTYAPHSLTVQWKMGGSRCIGAILICIMVEYLTLFFQYTFSLVNMVTEYLILIILILKHPALPINYTNWSNLIFDACIILI